MGVEGRITKGQNYRELCKLTFDIEEIEDSLTLLELWKLTFDIAEREHSQLKHLKKPNLFGISCQRSMAINEIICLPAFVFTRNLRRF